jgi:hypothetical protein
VERQGDLLCNSRTAPVGIALLHFDGRTDEFCARSFRAGLPSIRGEQHAVLLLAQGFVKAKQCRRLQNDCGTEQSRRVGRTKSAIKPARMRSDVHKFGDRCRERATIKSSCLRIRDSATMERTPPGASKRASVARKWIKRMTRLLIEES